MEAAKWLIVQMRWGKALLVKRGGVEVLVGKKPVRGGAHRYPKRVQAKEVAESHVGLSQGYRPCVV